MVGAGSGFASSSFHLRTGGESGKRSAAKDSSYVTPLSVTSRARWLCTPFVTFKLTALIFSIPATAIICRAPVTPLGRCREYRAPTSCGMHRLTGVGYVE